jgi:ABC-type dipeptide/oligopeptide/nickel transport system permease subunit
MGVLDDHNHQHTYGNSLGPPTSVAGVSAQQAIDTNKRLLEQCGQGFSAGQPPRGRDHLKIALVSLAISAVVALAAYMVGGFGAVALGLVAAISGLFGSIFLLIALVTAVKS